MKVTRSAEFTDSNNSTNSYVSPWIQNEYSWIWKEINPWNPGTNPTDFMSIGVL
jgi:hypothetical protein